MQSALVSPPAVAQQQQQQPTTANSSALENPKRSLFALTNAYISRMIPADRSMKILLVDRTTLPIVAMSYSQTQLLSRGVFLVDQVTGNRQRREMKAMRCVVFISPDMASVEAACHEVSLAKYSEYSVVFCGVASSEHLDRLARADAESLVTQVEEVFCAYCAVNSDAFLLEAGPSNALLPSQVPNGDVRRIAEALAAMGVAMRRRPLLRFQKGSAFAARVARELEDLYKRDAELYNYRHKDCVLLILDRSEDPVTPLLTPWTYQAMLHEHIGLDHNKLHLPEEVKGAEKDGYVFSQQDDLFFSTSMFLNWGDLCSTVQQYVEKCKAALNLDRNTATMEEVKQFMQKMPQTKSLTGSVVKHTTVVAHLSSVVKQRDLLEVSRLEQDMVASQDEGSHWSRLQALASKPSTHQEDLLRLCLLFYLRYEGAGQQPSRTAPLLDCMSSRHTELLRKLRGYYGADRSTDALFGETGVMDKIMKTFADVENIYTQHQPLLRKTLLKCYSGLLDPGLYPYAPFSVASSPAQASNAPSPSGRAGFRPKEVMVYMCGGCTFAEAALVHAINAGTAFKPSELNGFEQGPHGVRALLGGSALLNSREFIQELHRLPLPS